MKIRHTSFENNKAKNVELIGIGGDYDEPTIATRAADEAQDCFGEGRSSFDETGFERYSDLGAAGFKTFISGLLLSDMHLEHRGWSSAVFSVEGTDRLELFEMVPSYDPYEQLERFGVHIKINDRETDQFVGYEHTTSGSVMNDPRLVDDPEINKDDFVFGRVTDFEIDDRRNLYMDVEPCHWAEADICLHKNQLDGPDEFAKYLAANSDESMIQGKARRIAMGIESAAVA